MLPRRRAAHLLSGTVLFLVSACGETTEPDLAPVRTETSVLQMLTGLESALPADDASVSRANPALQWAPAPTTGVLLPSAALVAPDTVRAGEPFTVQIGSIVLSGCWVAGPTAISRSDRTVLLEPSDVYTTDRACIEVLLNISRTVAVTIATPGLATLRVRGRRVEQWPSSESPVTVEKQIVVR
ncbi:hypothetical protein [Gemmatimonas sp.]|uniref:hypothetical protein n=1 Tax=Gemmatimonas sp. TaxID=1962908 RepID=UPI00286A30CF|nr:hypothetical protein [Gemmatimonas sp.]